MWVRVCECGKQKKIENDKNVIYVLLLASIYIKVCVSPKQASGRRKNMGEAENNMIRGCFFSFAATCTAE